MYCSVTVAAELAANEAANSGCGYDNDLLWSSTECENGRHFAVAGGKWSW